MKISAKIILDSISPAGSRLTTMQLVYPRFIHSEFMTHRVFSRNAASSRAIPVAKMIEQVRTDPAIPIHWGANQPGMQARAEVEGENRAHAEAYWRMAAESAATIAANMSEIGLHKQVANRILEPFQWMHTIVTATEWDNFFSLRMHPDAEPNIQRLAEEMKMVMNESTPLVRTVHLPYIREDELPLDTQEAMMVSAARCARVSYLTHDGQTPDKVKDLELAERLKESRHASPFEHIATADEFKFMTANFRGWKSYRWTLGI